ncbi:MAG: GIY-YIG nuclease family protein [Rhodocyclales bacterium]|nr:GIY-YIG nuclease family protein [Rhodocyclales bacterium]
MCAVYKIVHRATGRCYVGSSVDHERRWRRHREDLQGDRHHNTALLRAWKKYGPEAFDFEVLEECSAGRLRERERYWINELAPAYNSLSCVDDGILRHSDEARRKMSEAQRRRWADRRKLGTDKLSAQHRARIAAAHIGIRPSEEARQKMSEAALRRGPPELSQEARRRSAEKQRGKVLSEQHRSRLQEARQRWLRANRSTVKRTGD